MTTVIGLQANDSFSNTLARTGADQQNFLSYTEYPVKRFTRNYSLMRSLYRNSWICRRIVDCVAIDALKNWVQFESKDLEAVTKMNKLTRRLGLRAKLLQCVKWGRLFGGAAGLIVIKGEGKKLDTPLELDKIKPGSFAGIIPLDRWVGIYPQPQLVADPSDPDFGLPAFYYIQAMPTAGSLEVGGINNTMDNSTIRVHHSRVLRFIGDDLPIYERATESYWGASCLEQVFDELKKRDNTSYNIAQLIFLANIRVMKKAGAGSVMELSNEKAKKRLYQTLKAQNQMMSNGSMHIIGEEDEFQNFQYSFGGISEVYTNFMMDVSGAADIPDFRLYGRSIGSSGDMGQTSMNNYNDRILQVQNTELQPIMDKLFAIMAKSEGLDPTSVEYRFMPSATMSQKDISDMTWRTYESIIAAYSRGLVSRNTALKELQRAGQSLGIFKDIEIDSEITPFEEYADNNTKLGANSFENRMGNTKATVGKQKAGESTEPDGTESDKLFSNRDGV